MTEVYRFSESEILFFFLVLMRMTAFVVSWPVFGVETVSSHIKILFALLLTMVIFSTLKISPEQAAALKSDLALLTIKEVFVGLAMGFLARMFFFTFRVTGEMLAQSMGLTSAQMFFPALGGQSTSLEQIYGALATLFYLGVNGHHHLITGIVNSYQWVPAAQATLNVSQFTGVTQLVAEVVEMGLRFSAPVMISLLVINMVLGVVGKTVPQLNVLVTSFPVNIMCGLFLIFVTLPMMTEQMGEYLAVSTTRVFQLVKSF